MSVSMHSGFLFIWLSDDTDNATTCYRTYFAISTTGVYSGKGTKAINEIFL